MQTLDLPGPWTFQGQYRHDGRDGWRWENPQGQSLLVVPAYAQAPGTPTAMTLVGFTAEPYHSEGRIRLRFVPSTLISRVYLPYPAPHEIDGLLGRLLDHQRPENTSAAYDALESVAEAWALATMTTWTGVRSPHAKMTISLSDVTFSLNISIGHYKERTKTRRIPQAVADFFCPIEYRHILVFLKVPRRRPQSAHERIAVADWIEQTRTRLLATFDTAAWAPKEDLRRQLLRDLDRLPRWIK